jgi:hypothetical protein
MIGLFIGTVQAGAGKEAVLTAKSTETGKAQLNIKIWDVYDAVLRPR